MGSCIKTDLKDINSAGAKNKELGGASITFIILLQKQEAFFRIKLCALKIMIPAIAANDPLKIKESDFCLPKLIFYKFIFMIIAANYALE